MKLIILVFTVIFFSMINLIKANHEHQNNYHLRHHNHTLNSASEDLSKKHPAVKINHHNHTHSRSHINNKQQEVKKTRNNNKNSPYIAINANHYGDGGGHGSYDDARRVQQSDQNWRTTSNRHSNNNRGGIEMIDDEWNPNAERVTPKTQTTARNVPRRKNPRQNNIPRQNAAE